MSDNVVPPASAQQATQNPATAQPAVAQPVATQPIAVQPVAAQPATAQQAAPAVAQAPAAVPTPAAPAPVAPAVPGQSAAAPAAISGDDLLAQKLSALNMAIKTNNVPNVVTTIIDYSIVAKSSDIHIEPEDELIVRIRIRIDGVLKEVAQYQPKMHPAIVSRIKIISNLKIDEQRIPQDGRAEFTAKDPFTQGVIEADLRVSTLPTVTGEKIVMRIQDKSKEIPGFDILGIQGKSYDYLQEALALPNGVCLVSGPTGSGKTNTLYASLKQLNKEDVNILTIEDPVEYQMKGLNQAQVHPDIDFTFATGLRAALRQDPDVIMIGEIRDYETIEIAIRAALTGHLVFSTIHTNSSVDTITRIQNMGIAGFLIAAAVKMVVAQRLVRRVCPDCKEESPISETERKDLQETIEKIHPSQTIEESLKNNMIFYRGKGCAKCHDTGYSGRVGLFEILMIKDEISEMIIKGATRGEMQYAAMHAGMITLKQDGIIKALEGKTSVEEVYRVANSM